MAISSTQADAFSDGDLGVFQYLAGSLSGGFRRLQDLRNLELESEVVERRQAESAVKVSLAVQRVSNVFLRMESEDDWDYVVLHCQREVENVIDCDGFGINFVDMETNTFDPRWADDDDSILRGKSNDLPAAIREAIESNIPIYRRNQHEIEQLGGVAHPERLSIIDVPFNGGTIAINSRREEAFSPQDIEILQQFAQVISEANRRLQDIQLLDSHERQLHQAQMMEAIGQLAAGIAHNFNNMLQDIMGNLFLATREAVSDSQREMLEIADTAARRAAGMLRQLLTFSHPGSQRRLESIDPGTRLADVVEMGRRTFDRRIDLTLDIAEDLPAIEVDSGQFEQVALNVLINARDAVMDLQDRTPKIHVAMDQYTDPADEKCYLRIRTTDNGAGMDADTRARIGEPFFTTKTVDKCTGLGLSTVYSIGRLCCMNPFLK
ncbi:MAG: sensor histidine kinase [Candidatus Latescibacterota bacterium]